MIRDPDSRRRGQGGDHDEIPDPSGEGDGDAQGADISAAVEDELERAVTAAPLAPQPTALEEQQDRYMRLAAEFDNFRRRTNKEKLEMGTRAQAALAATLLESLDDLARVRSMNTEGADASAFVQGVDLVGRKLMKALSNAGLAAVEPLNEQFDPKVHDAVSTEPASSPEQDGTIAAVFQPGYLFKGQLLRPAAVVVRKWNG